MRLVPHFLVHALVAGTGLVAAAGLVSPASAETVTLADALARDPDFAKAQAQKVDGGQALGDLSDSSLYEETPLSAPRRQIHGEMGMMVGTGGARGIYGAADVPLGENADAQLMFSSERYNWGHRRY